VSREERAAEVRERREHYFAVERSQNLCRLRALGWLVCTDQADRRRNGQSAAVELPGATPDDPAAGYRGNPFAGQY
jgi:hypothetical protein